MNKSETFKNCVLYIWFVTLLVIIGIFIGESINLIEYEKSYVKYTDVFEHIPATKLISAEDVENLTELEIIITDKRIVICKELIFERIIEKGKGQMTYNFTEHNTYIREPSPPELTKVINDYLPSYREKEK